MGKRKKRECAYCGRYRDVSKDHVIPTCLFTKPYPPNLITVLACDECNHAKSWDDDFLRDLLTTDVLGSQSPIAAELLHKVKRSLGSGYSVVGKNLLTQPSIEPFYTHGGIYLGNVITAPVEIEQLHRTFYTIVRGLYYHLRKQRIPSNYNIEIRRYFPWEYEEIFSIFRDKFHAVTPKQYGEVFGYTYTYGLEDPFTSAWLMWFYKRVVFTVFISNPEFEGDSAVEDQHATLNSAAT